MSLLVGMVKKAFSFLLLLIPYIQLLVVWYLLLRLTGYKRIVLLPVLSIIVGMATSSGVYASTSSELFIVSSDSGAEVKSMEIKAINENGEVRMVSGFAISIENVVSVQPNGKVTVFSAPTSPIFTSAKITDTNDRIVEIPITDTGVISLAGYAEGVYTLDVIVDDRYAFESIVVIGAEEGQISKLSIII